MAKYGLIESIIYFFQKRITFSLKLVIFIKSHIYREAVARFNAYILESINWVVGVAGLSFLRPLDTAG